MFLDEIHRFNKAQQDALLPAVEEGLLVLIGATTENPFFEVNPPLRSRSTLFRLEPLGRDALRVLAARGLEAEGFTAADDAVEHLVDRAEGDGRQLLTALEVAVALAKRPPRRTASTWPMPRTPSAPACCATARTTTTTSISAFIKSIRGSDVDASLHYLGRMLEAGEDARFIARRLVILASEDVGMADPMALVVADAAARAVEFVGPARGPAQPGPGGRAPGHGAEEQPGGPGRVAGPGGRAQRHRRRGAQAPARRPLPRGEDARPRQGLRVPS